MRTAFLLAITLTAAIAEPPHSPGQPATGLGGAEYRHARVGQSVYGEGGKQFWLFEPQEPLPEKAPLVIFLHGYSVMYPSGYQAWIEHIVRRGAVVVYPRYQEKLLTPPAEFHTNTLASVREAVKLLGGEGHVHADLDRVAVVGHSAGGVIGLNYTLAAAAEKLPVPKALVAVQPGGGSRNGIEWVGTEPASELPPELRFIAVVGDADKVVADVCARRMWRDSGHLKQRAFVTVVSDLHGEPRLRAGHLSPMSATGLADVHDWLGWWRTFDAACDSAFFGVELKLDAGMGTWSDGTPLKPLKIER